MSDLPTPSRPDQPDNPGPEGGAQTGPLPIARPAGGSEKKVGDESILELADPSCPRCHATLGADDVVCVKCGYDLKANVIRTPEVGVDVVADEADEPEKSKRPEFVPEPRSGATGIPVLLAVGAILAVCAMVAAGIHAGEKAGWTLVMARVLMVLYTAVVYSVTGVVAVLVASILFAHRFSRTDHAAARMFVVTSAFLLIANLGIPWLPEWIGKGLLAGCAALVYWLLVMFLFKKDRQPAAAVMVVHAALCFLLWLGMVLSGWVSAEIAALPAK
jgi:hypothetical protein